MGKFNRGGGSGGFGGGSRGGFRGGDRGGRPSFQKKSWGGDRGSDRSSDRQMFATICNECKKNCEVPFRPSGEKPVYCSDCFRKEENGGGGREQRSSFGGGRDRERSFDRGSERPSFAKLASADNEGLKKQLSEINSKLDRLINAIKGMSKTKSSAPVASPKIEVKSEAVSKVSKKEVSKKSGGKVNSKKK